MVVDGALYDNRLSLAFDREGNIADELELLERAGSFVEEDELELVALD